MSSTVDNLPKKMNAVVNHGRGDFRYEEVPVPRPGRQEVLIRISWLTRASKHRTERGDEVIPKLT
jgi:NADPH-dependent curcumin reductase CurA